MHHGWGVSINIYIYIYIYFFIYVFSHILIYLFIYIDVFKQVRGFLLGKLAYIYITLYIYINMYTYSYINISARAIPGVPGNTWCTPRSQAVFCGAKTGLIQEAS